MINKTIYILLATTLLFGACNFLDYREEDFYQKDDIFGNFDRTKSFLAETYGRLPSGFNEVQGSMRESASDNAEEAYQLANIQAMNDGRWSATRTVDAYWIEMYQGIRSANVLLQNLDVSALDDRRYNDDYNEMVEEYELFDEQARFLRAYFYFELMRRYGGVPLLNGEVLTLDNVNSVESSSFEEVKNFIVSECNDLIDGLPVNYDDITGGPHEGRATKGAALALKSRTLLYAASPLHGSSAAEWEAAAEAAADLIFDTELSYDLEGDYGDVVNNSESVELIMGRRFEESSEFERANFPVGYEGARPGTCPTQNLVDTYEMANGMDIDETGSGYDPQNPYENRDPRLSKTVIYNNAEWKGRNVEMWRGGLDGQPKDLASPTGYYLKKYVQEGVSLDPDAPSSATHLWVFFRYAEVILNYAEAMNEAYGPNADPEGYGMTAVEAMNMIRDRAGIDDYAGALTKAAVREEIREERRVELAFENHRFWDIRRWEVGDQTTEIYGMEVVLNEDESFTYNKVMVEERSWDPKMNLYPIPQSEIFKNSNLTQNPDW